MRTDLLVATALLGLAASLAGAAPAPRIRIHLSVALIGAACCCAFALATDVLATGAAATVSTSRLLPLLGFALRLDRLGALFVAVTAGVGLFALIFRLGYRGHGLASRTASCTLPLFVTSLLLVPAASAVGTFLFLWELMAATSLVLVLADHRARPEVQRAGHWYGVMTQFGAAVLTLALVLLATHAGSQSFAVIAARAHHLAPWVRSTAFVLAVVGFASKAGAVPLHVWLPRAHPEAPGPVSALMSAAMVNLGIYGIVRVGDTMLGGGPAWWWLLVMALGGLSALFGALHSSTSTDLKRLLAYSTTDNVGLILLGVGASGLFAATGNRELAVVALVAALLHVVFHAVFKGALFLSASSLEQSTGLRDLDRMGGLVKRLPLTAPVFIVAGLAICALPPLCGFVSEWLLLQSLLHGLPSADTAVEVAMPLGVGILALTGGLTAAAFVKAIGIGILGQARSDGAGSAGEVPAVMWAAAGGLAVLCVLFGVAPFLVIPAVEAAARSGLGYGTTHPLTQNWSVGVTGVKGLIGPGLLALGLTAAVALTAGVRRLAQRGGLRETEAWGCGREVQTARMQYTATSFGEPLARVFDDVLAPAHDLDVSHSAESRYYVESVAFHTSTHDAFERHAYRPLSAALKWWGNLARRVPNGSVHRYLTFGLAALVVVLMVIG
jgi:formate hydrogenlyase subunit 3/multisubunit Na+/H+ antiporter MnhD subunit